MSSYHPDDCECPECVVKNSPECSVCRQYILQGHLLPLAQIYRCYICDEILCYRCKQPCKTCGCAICPRCAKEESLHCVLCRRHLDPSSYIQWGREAFCSWCDPYWQLTWQRDRVAILDRQVQRRLARKSQHGEWLRQRQNSKSIEPKGHTQGFDDRQDRITLPPQSYPPDERCPECCEIFIDYEQSDVCTTHYEIRRYHKHCLDQCTRCGVPICRLCSRESPKDCERICSNCDRFEHSFQRYKKHRESRQN